MSEVAENGLAQRTSATIERSRWPGWIWAVPLAALGIVAWLAFRAFASRGVDITIRFDRAAGMKAGDTSLQYRGLSVGKLTELWLSNDGQYVYARVNVDENVKKFLRTGTQFWLQGGNPSLSDLSSLKAIVAGPTIIMEAGGGKPSRSFIGLDHRPTISGVNEPMIPYLMSFDGDVGQLKIDAPVKLRGFTVGRVAQVGIQFDLASGTLKTPVVIELDAKRFSIQGLKVGAKNWTGVLNLVMQRLTKQGLRGRLVQSPSLIGDYIVALDFVQNATDATLNTNGPIPEIPTVTGGGVTSVVRRVNQIPIDQIANQVLAITNKVQSLVSSPELQDSFRQLDLSLVELNVILRRSGPRITDLVQSLQQTANEMDGVAQSADHVLGAGPANQDRNVQAALYELTGAARSVRLLADYLNQHPEAVLKGKDGE
jgi:paraquat-inducible protein B